LAIAAAAAVLTAACGTETPTQPSFEPDSPLPSFTVVPAAWSAGGSGTVTVLNDGTTGDPSMSYSHRWYNFSGSWTFSTTAATTQQVQLPWTWNGCHSWYMSTASIDAFVTRPGSGTFYTRVGNSGGCSFLLSGTAVLNVQAGDTYGFLMKGSHYDSSYLLVGTLTITLPVADSDGDGVPDNQDAFPNDPTETVDTDGDGVGDNGDAFPNDPSEWADSDGDGHGDNGDAFPSDPSEWADSDGDGHGDNGDAFPNSNLGATVVIRGCNTGVGNQLLPNGATFNDLIGAALASSGNHGQFVSSVTGLADGWKKAGLISGKDQGAITSCAARSR